LENVSQLSGTSVSDLAHQGFRYEKGALHFGKEGGETFLKHVSVRPLNTNASPALGQAYTRSLKGGPLSFAEQRALITPVKYLDAAGKAQQEAFMFTGGQSRLQAAKRSLSLIRFLGERYLGG
jgi:hypothetical protein